MIDITAGLVLVGLLSIFCQYFAYRIKLPAILPLLIVGIIVGPVTGVINADQIFGDLLFPVVSLSVAIILFEGALTLRFDDLRGHGSMVRNLCTSGAVLTWCLVAVITHLVLDMSWEMAFLFGAIVTVTGPTVIVPMLRTVRPSNKLANILRWEGIIIDPIGALLAVLVYEYIISTQDALSHTLWAFSITVGIGLGVGAVMGYLLGLALRRNLIPHYLRNTAVLTLMLGAFAGSNMMAHESGLLTVTIMGMWLANMRDVDVDDILEFKETLSVLLISGLFILLASRIQLDSILNVGWGAIIVLLAIMFVVRPISVMVSSLKTGLNWREQAFLSWVAPRGIVAAAVSALFSLKLEALNYAHIEVLVPLVFLVIISTVVVQSLTAVHVAQWLGIRAPKPNGYLIFGGGEFCRMFAKELMDNDVNVCVADTNWDSIRSARMLNIPTYFGNPMSEHASRTLDFTLFGRVLVMSPYRQLNPMVTFHFEDEMGKGTVLGLSNNEQQQRPSHQVSESYAKKLGLFSDGITYGKLASWVAKGAKIKTTRLTESFSMEDYLQEYEGNLLLLCAFDSHNKLRMITNKKSLEPKAGWRIMSLVIPKQIESETAVKSKDDKS
ncbi:sodium:proton antiporter [Aliiglaciecola sp. 2_MG-2023]|uniref:cation:proton antiporter n=1 Tax=unclassified Aliiglaciecola TaxID=2593648 RepID=UPI0026E127DA|nr:MULTISPECIES: sodium:proton antiporter [unclassified Aliiglaciecola]MDO6709319.1 sodium:proton antiporter [Aliiglaciecola sp. 2_MG-2023]MDO6750467.1 sodium:proton antiporter [Aliiglaciecola sp. 1_MG-2023]